MKKIVLLTLLCSLFLTSGLSRPYRIKDLPPKTALEILQKAYPNEIKEIVYDYKWKDWAMIAKTYSGDNVRLFWEEGKLLTEEQIPESHKYRSQFYGYPKKMKDPADMDDRYIAELKSYTSKEARRNGAISSPVFFDTLYDASSQESIENRLTRISFLGRRMTVHEKIAEPLARVEKSIYHKRIWNADVRGFLHDLASCDCYHWREIRDSNSRSFHSYAVAVDVLPEGWGNKIVYWNWERSRNPDWMLVPISKRWCPPQAVIDSFETEGFIWGGKWAIWDNMHFEYRPELFLFTEAVR